ncbi:tetratricopeptide repeat protein [Bradyrhizobium sp. WSM3983]|uniref:tetratricopeptide repeat protein n=1 Tax=Bradyrhizobium sp. WSM3983 TaxID=1038867 RepID=UPI00047FEE86|nr:tetratricopeptide repeat protein [Bradyrhizobium sp. WSM3983]
MQMRSTVYRLFPWLTVAALAGMPIVAVADDADTCARQSGDAAIAACSRAIASGEFTGEELAKIYLNRGAEYKNKGDLDRAIADYSEAIRVDPKRVAVYINRGNA